MQKITSIINNRQGAVILIAVLMLALVTVIGTLAALTSTTEVQMSTNGVLHNLAFYTADSGIAAGRAALNNIKIIDAGSWDNLLFNIAAPAGSKISIQWNDPDCDPTPCDCSLPGPDPLCYTLNDIIDADGGRTVGPVTFSLAIVDNDDLDGDPQTDSDDTIILTSTLDSPYRNATATILTTVRGGGEAYAQEHYNAGSFGEAVQESEAAEAVVRW